jgi:hypothetical protein
MTEIEGRDVAIKPGFEEWRLEQPALLQFTGPEGYFVHIYEGAPDRDEHHYGFTMYWHDGVANEWAEHFNDLGTTIARVAALAHGAARDMMFKDGPVYFTRWSDNFFRQTLTDHSLSV